MTMFALGFLFISLFTLFVGIAAMVFVGFDAQPSENPRLAKSTGTYPIVRRINTEIIETVDKRGVVQQWQKILADR